MRLQRQNSREYKGKKYYKHWIVLPNSLIEKMGLNEGDEFDWEIVDGKIVIRKKEGKKE